MIVILGLDGLEYNFVEKWNLRNLKQQQYGKLKVPILEETGAPTTPSVWASFLTGRYVNDLKLIRSPIRERALDVLKFIRKHVNVSLRLGAKVTAFRFPKLREKTFLDYTDSIEINVPFYSFDYATYHVLQSWTLKSLSLEGTIEALWAVYFKRKQQILNEAKKFRNADIAFAYMHFPDILQHFLFPRPSRLKKLYLDLDHYVFILRQKLEGSNSFIIVSDHGFDLQTELHSTHGFYSSNVELSPEPNDITDFYHLISTEIRFT